MTLEYKTIQIRHVYEHYLKESRNRTMNAYLFVGSKREATTMEEEDTQKRWIEANQMAIIMEIILQRSKIMLL